MLLRVLPDGDVHFPDAPGACVVVNPCLSGGALEIFLEPSCRHRWCGSAAQTPIAEALAQLCAGAGLHDVQHATGDDLERRDRGGDRQPRRREAETIRAALDAGVGYIGLVASQGARRRDRRRTRTSTEAERARVHTPVGLRDRGADPGRDRAVDPGRGDRARSGSSGLAVAQRERSRPQCRPSTRSAA